jgi:hypothetical protein
MKCFISFQPLFNHFSESALERCNEKLTLDHINQVKLTMEMLLARNQEELQNGKLCNKFPPGIKICCNY